MINQMKLMYKGMKKFKKILWSEKVVSQGMQLLYQGMKKSKKNLGSEKVPFGYEKKPVFENFPFHTLGYENFGCFFLMNSVQSSSPESFLILLFWYWQPLLRVLPLNLANCLLWQLSIPAASILRMRFLTQRALCCSLVAILHHLLSARKSSGHYLKQPPPPLPWYGLVF
jgi:hypothetical protein